MRWAGVAADRVLHTVGICGDANQWKSYPARPRRRPARPPATRTCRAEGEKDQAAGNVKDACEKIKDVFWPGPALGRVRHLAGPGT